MDEWLSLIGIGEDGAEGLSSPARAALARAELVFGGPRHLAMIDHPDKRNWPVPFSTVPLLALRGQRRVAALISGDPFWHGAGGSLARDLSPEEWRCFGAPSVFSLAAARLGWRLEDVSCLGLHAAPLASLRRHLQDGARLIVTLRDGAAPAELARWLNDQGFGGTQLWVMERLGGAAERITAQMAAELTGHFQSPVACALQLRGRAAITLATGRDDALFAHDGQITKRPVRALALSALAPRAGEMLWDLGTGSGSIALEWLLAHPANRAIGIERDPARADRAAQNAANLGLPHFQVLQGLSADLIDNLPRPDAVFIGGGLGRALLDQIWSQIPDGCRLVAHAVTLESESILVEAASRLGGDLLRIELAEAAPLGRFRGWKSAYPILQWRVEK